MWINKFGKEENKGRSNRSLQDYGLQVEHLESRYQNCLSTLSLRDPCVLFCYIELTNDLMLDQLEFDQQQLRMKPKHRLHCDHLFFSVKSCCNLWTDDI